MALWFLQTAVANELVQDTWSLYVLVVCPQCPVQCSDCVGVVSQGVDYTTFSSQALFYLREIVMCVQFKV
jgi:hypothetical protein